ncbi:WhiB family transcriptional regulator [Streptomyces sp. NPDC007084]|uniref:WhiB family transcriptional regulator n=1 Tax=Streptomyces sp. NPDC007084 TaxID=3154313 RepID=UPI003454CECA
MSLVGPRAIRQRADRVGIPFPRSEGAPRCSAEPELFQWDADGPPLGGDADRVTRRAKSICRKCSLAEACLKWALANEELAMTGIWGATTVRERRALRARLLERLGPEWIARLGQEEGNTSLLGEVRERGERADRRLSAA